MKPISRRRRNKAEAAYQNLLRAQTEKLGDGAPSAPPMDGLKSSVIAPFDWPDRMPALCEAGRRVRAMAEGWGDPCPREAAQYLVSDAIDLPQGFTVHDDVHEAFEAWLCDAHLEDLLCRAGWNETVIRAMQEDPR